MEKLIIEKTDSSPAVCLDHVNNKFEIIGESRPENAKIFYLGIIDWFKNYESYLYWLKDNINQNFLPELNFKLHYDYINSSSLKFLYDVLKVLENLKTTIPDLSVKITWVYDIGDEDMLDNGNEFATMLKLKFDIIEYVKSK